MKAILKQTSWLVLAQVLTRAVGFFYTIFLANSLGVSDFGVFTVGFAYFAIVSSIADFGFNRYLIREVAREESKSADLISNIVMMRLTSAAVFFAIFSAVLYFFDPDSFRVSIILLSTLAILPQSVAITLDGIFVGLRKLEVSSFALFTAGISTVGAGFILVSNGFGVIGAANALLLGQLMYVVILLIMIYKNRISILSKVSFSTMKKIVVGSLPYGLLGVLGLVYFRIDTILLSYLRGSFETGIYGASYRFLEAANFVPASLFAALFPVFSKLDTSLNIKKLYFKTLYILGMVGILVLLGYILILPPVIRYFLPSYVESIGAINILSLSIPFMFVQAVTVSILFSKELYLKQIIFLSVFLLIFNIIANLIFIPAYGFMAAAWITVISEILSFIVFFLFIKSKILNRVD